MLLEASVLLAGKHKTYKWCNILSDFLMSLYRFKTIYFLKILFLS